MGPVSDAEARIIFSEVVRPYEALATLNLRYPLGMKP